MLNIADVGMEGHVTPPQENATAVRDGLGSTVAKVSTR